MKPDYDRAATAAAETLIKYHINSAPVSAKRVFKESKIAYLMTFTEMSERMGIDRHSLLSSFNTENRDAITSVFVKNGKTKYIVAYNTRLSESIVQRALARELGHIVLGHDGTRPEEVRNAEASCFAQPLMHISTHKISAFSILFINTSCPIIACDAQECVKAL